MSDKLNASLADGGHALLAKLSGNWQGTAKTWFEPTTVADESPVTGTITSIMGGRFLLFNYKSAFGEKATEGLMILAYQLAYNRFQSAWVDSFHTGTAIMFSEGDKQQQTFNVNGSYPYVTPEVEQLWGWRTTIEQPAADEIIITAYNITPEGEEAKATETRLTRVL